MKTTSQTENRKKRRIGYIIILLGLLFITIPFIRRSYNLINSSYESKKFFEEMKNKPELEVSMQDEEAARYNDVLRNSETAMIDPFTATEFEVDYDFIRDSDEVFAYLSIPKLNRNDPIYLGASQKHMADGVAQVDGTAIPIGGIGNRSVIAGHRGWWGDVRYLYLHKLKNGDRLYVKRGDKTLTYEVIGQGVIGPYDWEKLEADKDRDLLTLMTCEPFRPPRPNRLIINCERIAEETALEKAEMEAREKALAEGAVAEKTDLASVETDENNVPTDRSVLINNFLSYAIAAAGSIGFVYTLVKFIRELTR